MNLDQKCDLCGGELEDAEDWDYEDYYCFGCGHHICLNHPIIMGPHRIEDHGSFDLPE